MMRWLQERGWAISDWARDTGWPDIFGAVLWIVVGAFLLVLLVAAVVALYYT